MQGMQKYARNYNLTMAFCPVLVCPQKKVIVGFQFPVYIFEMVGKKIGIPTHHKPTMRDRSSNLNSKAKN